jgi:hypothetical protein
MELASWLEPEIRLREYHGDGLTVGVICSADGVLTARSIPADPEWMALGISHAGSAM